MFSRRATQGETPDQVRSSIPLWYFGSQKGTKNRPAWTASPIDDFTPHCHFGTINSRRAMAPECRLLLSGKVVLAFGEHSRKEDTRKRKFKLPWREAGPPNDLDVVSDQ